MSTNLIQPALSSGELSPSLFARVDLERFQTGVSLMRNFFVDYRGGATTRFGTSLSALTYKGTLPVRVIRFSFNTNQNYILEFGHLYVRIIKNGELILNPLGNAITAINQSTQALVTSVLHGLVEGDQVFITNVVGMTEVNNQTFVVSFVNANSYRLKYLNGSFVNSTAFTAYVSGGLGTVILKVVTPYDSSDLFDLKYAQSGDILTITHPSYAQRELSRVAEDNWTLTTISFASSIAAPTVPVATQSGKGQTKYAYVITAVTDEGEESVASTRATLNAAVNIAAKAGTISIAWVASVGADYYNIYKANPVTGNGISIPTTATYGFIGRSTASPFVDPNITPDFTRTPPKQINPFSGVKWPACVTYYQQRIVYAGSNTKPETIYMSQTAQFKNFDEALPLKDDDAIEATVASLEINRIKYMVAMPGGLLVLTSGSAFQVNGGGPDAPMTPSTVSAVPQTYNGCGNVSPIPIDFNILYVQNQGSIIRALSYNFYTGSYTPSDVSIFSNHLVRGFDIVDWAYAEEPGRIVWAARSDGRLISLTYLPEQKIAGMALHSTQGIIESTATIQEGHENPTYMVVKRKINGTWTRFIERMENTEYRYGTEDAWQLDCALDRVLTTPNATLTPAAKTGTGIVFTASAAVFLVGHIGRIIRVGGGIATITGFTDTTHVVCAITRDIQECIPETDTPLDADAGDWSMATQVTTLTGLWHLEGMTVSALADGVPRTGLVVTNGSVTLPVAASKITVGLPYTAKIKTLPIDTGSLPTIQGKRKNIHALTVRLNKAKGLKTGSKETTLVDMVIPAYESQYELWDGDIYTVMDPNWQEQGSYFVEQTNPLPASVLGFIPELSVGDTSK